MVMQIQVQIGDTRRVFFLLIRLGVLRILKNCILREIPRTPFMDFGLLYENDKGEYEVLNDVRYALYYSQDSSTKFFNFAWTVDSGLSDKRPSALFDMDP